MGLLMETMERIDKLKEHLVYELNLDAILDRIIPLIMAENGLTSIDAGMLKLELKKLTNEHINLMKRGTLHEL